MVSALLLGTAVLFASVLFFAVTIALIVSLMARVALTGYTGLSFWKDVAIMMVVTLITAAGHLVEISLWAVALLAIGELSTFEKAFYVSAENYTALGYGDILLSERWRLLGPFEAINGLLLFGLSTAAMFAVLSRLVSNRIHPAREHMDRPRQIDAG
jgi:hypothetical protein